MKNQVLSKTPWSGVFTLMRNTTPGGPGLVNGQRIQCPFTDFAIL